MVASVAGVLMAVALPTYEHVTASAQSFTAEANLTSAMEVEGAYFVTESAYASASQVQELAPQVAWTTALPATSGSMVTVDAHPAGSPANTVLLGETGHDGKYYWVELFNGRSTFATKATGTEPAFATIVGQSWASATTLH
jgi:Tfp pilus assembly major pilin PilA